MNEGLKLAQRGQLREAEVEFQKALRLQPDNGDALTALGEVEGRLGKKDEAVSLLGKAAAAKPTSSDAHVNLAMALADDSKLSDALAETELAIKLKPTSIMAHYSRARVLSDLGRVNEARAEFVKLRGLDPRFPDLYYYWALLERDQHNFEKETELLTTLTRLRPNDAVAFYLLGESLSKISREEDAIAAWRKAIAIDPDYPEPLYRLSRSLQHRDHAEAEALLARLSKLQQDKRVLDRVHQLGNQANAEMYQQHWNEAIADLDEAITLCGTCAALGDLHKNLGLANCYMGQLQIGEKELRMAQDLKPDDDDIGKALALVIKQQADSSNRTRGTPPD